MRKALYILFLLPSFVSAQSIHIAASATIVCASTPVHFSATTAGISAPHYKWKVNGSNAGVDSSGFTTSILNNGDSVKCLLVSSTADTVFANSDTILMTVHYMPIVSPIICTDSIICVGTTTILSDSTSGGVWGASNGNATDSAGIVTGIVAEIENIPAYDEITYTLTNSCGAITVTKNIEIDPIPDAGFFIGPPLYQNTVCVGGTLKINDDDGVNFGVFYSTTGHTGVFGDIFGFSAGTDFVYDIVTNACGADTFGVTITVLPIPSEPSQIVLPSQNICVGASLSLTDSSKGFSPSWFVRNSNAIIDSGNILKGMEPGIDTIIFTLSNLCGSASTTTTINILPPASIIGLDSFCIGGTITLSDTSSGGIWSVDNTVIATIDQAGVLNGIADDTVLVTYTLGPCTVTKKETIKPTSYSFYPVPPIQIPGNLCKGESITLSDNTAGGTWSSRNPDIAVIQPQTGIVMGNSAGIDTIIYKFPDGCITSTLLTVNQLPDPITGDFLICKNSSATLSNSGNGKWSTANTNIAKVNLYSGEVYGVSPGNATITYTLNTGCFDTTVVAIINCDSHATIFPNPASNQVVIQTDTSLYFAYAFINSIGQTIIKQPINGVFTKVNIQFLPSGLYFIILYGYDGKYVSKFVKE